MVKPCIICRKPCPAPAGNFNSGKPHLCSDKCKRARKTKLQRQRRAILELPLGDKVQKRKVGKYVRVH